MDKAKEVSIEEDLKYLTQKIREIETSDDYGIKSIYPIVEWGTILIHLTGVYLEYWDISFALFIGVFLYHAILNLYKNIIMRIEINTYDLNSILLSQIDEIRKKL